MIKEALQYIIGLGNVRTETIEGQVFATGNLQLIPDPRPDSIIVRSLSGFVEYLKSDFDLSLPLMVHVVNPTHVVAFSDLNDNQNRSQYVEAKAILPNIRFGNWYSSEEFNILLQSSFVLNDDRADMLKIVGNIEEENVRTHGDNGISQSVVAKRGLANHEEVKVPNPVELQPYRTFVEVDQPESEFIFRMRTGDESPECALFEADGGAWTIEAMRNVKEYLIKSLADEINEEKIIIIA